MAKRIDVEGGKYTVVVEDNGGLSALRNGEPWQDLTGNKLVYCLAAELQAARAVLKEINDLATTTPMDHPSQAMSFKVRVRDLSEEKPR